MSNKNFLNSYGEGGIAHLKVTEDKNLINDNLNHSDSDRRELVAKNLNLTSDLLSKLADDKSQYVRRNAATNKNTHGEVLDKLLTDTSVFVRMHAANNPNATKEQLSRAMLDDDAHVRKSVVANPSATKHHIDRALNDKHWEVRYNAISNPRASHTYLHYLSQNDPEMRVRALARTTIESRAFDDSLNDDRG